MENKEFLINELKQFIYKYNDSVIEYFGSWKEIFSQINIPEINKKYNRDDIISYLYQLYQSKGRTFSSEEYINEKHCPSYGYIKKEFGSWNRALKAANIPILKGKYTDEQILLSIKKFYEDMNGKISYDSYKSSRIKPSVNVITKRFGTWTNALRKAGIK